MTIVLRAAPLMLLFVAHVARAEDPAAADRLFKEGRKLLKDGRVMEACTRFEESNRAESSAGTMLNLASCREQAGQLAQAVRAYKDAAAAATVRKRTDWVETATAKVHELAPRVPVLTLALHQSDATVSVDGSQLATNEISEDLYLNPGPHRVQATARGKVWEQPVELTEGKRLRLEIPEFAKESGADAKRATTQSWMAPTGLVIMGVGIAGIGLGIVSGILASGKASDAKAGCPLYGNDSISEPVPCANRDAIDANNSAHTLASVSTVAFVAGGTLAAGGLALWLLSPRASKSVAWRPVVTPGIVAMQWSGTF